LVAGQSAKSETSQLKKKCDFSEISKVILPLKKRLPEQKSSSKMFTGTPNGYKIWLPEHI
jgi:hypothetical protein